ncbi:MAG: hypothetical protein MRZ28_09645 [Oscillospiraceae bacterium]|nr:hypothetical protein [Oscillospiraceae bacterium]MCM0708251.1 hypothetical protein [Faecalicatena sp. BF-R-105]MDY3218747.1 hypothetical protein [Candidatus Fimivivens sp.]SFJ64573.1 hypothetical protein SAMN02910435_02524 [Ruminococcaceae bacterium D5]GKH50255.1 hypothetical protein CE91St46_13660 [Eubacteriales bacterium]
MDDIERTVIELDQRSKSNTKRLDRLEKTTEAVQELATSVKLMAQSLDNMADEQKRQGERLEKLEQQPADRWNTIIKTMLTAVVSALAGGFAAMLIK